MFTKEQVQQFGTISSGTLRSNDIVPRFLQFLEKYAKKRFDDIMSENLDLAEAYKDCEKKHIYGNILLIEWNKDNPYWESEECFEMTEYLIDVICLLCPPGYYFGQNEGNASDFGFYPYLE